MQHVVQEVHTFGENSPVILRIAGDVFRRGLRLESGGYSTVFKYATDDNSKAIAIKLFKISAFVGDKEKVTLESSALFAPH
jgi:hypothetical protein